MSGSPAQPRPPEPPETPRILLCDADAFFVSVARLQDPEGVGREPLLIVGGSRESRGVVCSASYETRKFGVRSAMPIARALKLCPDAVCVPVPRRACSEMSRRIRSVLDRFAPVVEAASIDEWYLDLAGTGRLYHDEPLTRTAARIRQRIMSETGLSVSLGGGTSKLIAKLAVERAKPPADGVHVVPAGREAEFMKGIALAEIPMIGPRFQQRLASLGMRAVPDVLPFDLPSLSAYLGERTAAWLYARVRGIDERNVEPRLDARSISRDETFAIDLDDDARLEAELLALIGRAATDLRSDGLCARTVTVRVRDADFRTRQASRTLQAGVSVDRSIAEVARPLFRRLRAARRVPARLLGVALAGLVVDPGADQLALFEMEDRPLESERDRALARTVDALREKFGSRAIGPATTHGRNRRESRD